LHIPAPGPPAVKLGVHAPVKLSDNFRPVLLKPIEEVGRRAAMTTAPHNPVTPGGEPDAVALGFREYGFDGSHS